MNAQFSVSGIGLHTGAACAVEVTLRPDLPHHVIHTARGPIEVIPGNICGNSHLATDLVSGEARVRTVEHLLFGLCGFSERAVIAVDGPEIPILDGSADPWCVLARSAGATPFVRAVPVPSAARVRVGDSEAEVVPIQDGESPVYEIFIAFEGFPVGADRFTIRPFEEDFSAISSARTFALVPQIEAIREAGFGLGGSLDNALIIGADGVLNVGGMRMPDEPARHKMLDAIGDLSILGGLPRAHVTLRLPGHRLHHALVAAIGQNAGVTAGQSTAPSAAGRPTNT